MAKIFKTMSRNFDQIAPKLPKGVTWDDVELIPDNSIASNEVSGNDEIDKLLEEIPGFGAVETEIVYVARNKKTGEIYR